MKSISFQELKSLAKSHGLDDIGVADAKPVYDNQDWIIERAITGHRTEFEPEPYGLGRDPGAVLPGARHVIVLAKKTQRTRRIADILSMPLADIAVGNDYHAVMGPAVRSLAEELEKITGLTCYSQVDSGLLQERPFAVKAGLGILGKNTYLIHPEFGTYLTLGLILTKMEITGTEFHHQAGDSCGDCTICETACPGEAIGGYRLAAGRCIAYLSQKKHLGRSEMEKVTQVYGCDICQHVCPKNAKIQPFETDALQGIQYEDLQLSKTEFQNKYGYSAAFWRGPTLLKRNLLLGIGNRRLYEFEPIVERMARSESTMIREAAQYCLAKLRETIV